MRRSYGIYRQLKEIAASHLTLRFSKSLKCTVKLQRVMDPPRVQQSVPARAHLPLPSEGLQRALEKGKTIFTGFTWGWAESRPFY